MADGQYGGVTNPRRICVIMLAAFAVQPAIWAVQLIIAPKPVYPDFFALWSFGHYVLSHAPTAIYDSEAMHRYQMSLGMPGFRHYPFLYPPMILLLLTPFGALPYMVARLTWLVLSILVYVAALSPWRWPRPLLFMLLLAPSTSICVLGGQNGFLTAALILGGLRLLRPRPFVAGMLFGAFVYKPQLAVLVPFYLVFGGHWRALASAGLTAAVLAGAATAIFGPDMWVGWVLCMTSHGSSLSAGQGALLSFMPTVTSAVLLLGGSQNLAHAAQLLGAGLSLLALWQVRARQDIAALAILPLASILATPYSFGYDLPMVTGAILAILAERLEMPSGLGWREFTLYLGCIVAPVILVARLGTPTVAVPVIFGLCIWSICRSKMPALSAIV